MRLYFFRHAIAQESDANTPDDQRTLTSEGVIRTRRAARVLKQLNIVPNALYSSPLIRAHQTADLLAETLEIAVQVRSEVGPGFDAAAAASLISDLGEDAEVMFVGHEPDFSAAILALTGGRVDMKKGCLVAVEAISRQPLQGVLSLMIPPKLFNRLG
ncbi:MAG: phosphohistidine phosphatase SixA [Anaerolineae bacterium]|nr:phosphohistidine phosphatase SixA [Anaerolineae bacterium]